MNVWLKSVTLLEPSSPLHQQRVHLFIQNGKIARLEAASDTEPNIQADRIIEGDEVRVSIGWLDMQAHFGDPGLEHKEDLYSGSQAAAAGGFTEVALVPNTEPVLDTKNDLHYLLGRSLNLVKIHPLAAVTRSAEGQELTEMIDLHQAGAVAFSDGLNALTHRQVLLKALQYTQKFGGLLINRPEDTQLTQFGTMHEGVQSTLLGMKGMPSLSETLAVEQHIRLLQYASEFTYAHPPRLHLSNISTAESVALIRQAKQQELAITCDVAAHQLVMTDELLADFDTNYKVNPPLRTEADRLALLEGLKDGTIDVIVSSHQPQDVESKRCEFDLAEFGILGLPTFLPTLAQVASEALPWWSLLDRCTHLPRELLKLPLPKIAEGETANLTVFDPTASWEFNESTSPSKSNNHPWWGNPLTGRVLAVFNAGEQYLAP
ncbi:dihydroorotase [Tunicatimonas pelagia]|uniref:dihydroorotase n=1 Tax=Tunicatimonas pelagia TaxID=931531 RepID=UPI0026671F25|nr:dihydroorotase [Tunicatimonas pelagia]WKN41196.1 dihydroorotase [Tunicatimonas pelagia]